MISAVDIILKKIAKNRQKQKLQYGGASSSDSDDQSDDEVPPKQIRTAPIPAARTSEPRPVMIESSDDSAIIRTAHRNNQQSHKKKQQQLSSMDSLSSQEFKVARKQPKNRSTRSNFEINRSKKTNNVRSSVRSNKGKSSKKKGSKVVQDVQSDDEARGREQINTLSKKFQSFDMLNTAQDFDIDSRSGSASAASLQFPNGKQINKTNQPLKDDSQSDSSLRRRDDERRVKHKQLYLELKRRQEQERKEALMEKRRLKEIERNRLESGGSLSPSSQIIVQALKLGENQAPVIARPNTHSSGAQFVIETKGNSAPTSRGWAETELPNKQPPAASVKQIENNPTGARSKHHATTQAVIENSLRQSERRNAGPQVPNKPNKKHQQETHGFSTLPPVSGGNFQRGHQYGSQMPGTNAPYEMRGSYRPQQEEHPAVDASRPATLSHSRRHDYHATPNPVTYAMNQQWNQESYQSRGAEPRLNQEIPTSEPYYHEYEKFAPTRKVSGYPDSTQGDYPWNYNRQARDGTFGSAYESADLV